MNIPLSRMQRDDAFANIVSVRDFNDRGSRDPYAGFASRAGTGDFLDFGAVDDPKAFSGQGFGEATPYRTNIVAFLAEQNVVLGLPANDKRSTLVRLAARLGDQAGLSRGAVLAAMLRRERLGSTAIGHGVAIPMRGLREFRSRRRCSRLCGARSGSTRRTNGRWTCCSPFCGRRSIARAFCAPWPTSAAF